MITFHKMEMLTDIKYLCYYCCTNVSCWNSLFCFVISKEALTWLKVFGVFLLHDMEQLQNNVIVLSKRLTDINICLTRNKGHLFSGH